MEKIFEIASKISTPLALGGIITVAFFFILKKIISKDIFLTLTKSSSFNIIKIIIDRIFLLAFIAIIFGFFGYIFTLITENKYNQSSNSSQQIHTPQRTPKIRSNSIHSEISSKFRIMYFNIRGHAVDFLIKGKIDKEWEENLSGKPFIVTNEIFKELNFLRKKFSDSLDYSSLRIQSRNDPQHYISNPKKLHYFVGASDIFGRLSKTIDIESEEAKSILSSLESDPRWNFCWRYIGDSPIIKRNFIKVYNFYFWRFADINDLNRFYLRKFDGFNMQINFQKYITRNYFPLDFCMLDFTYLPCPADRPTLILYSRTAGLRIALIENITSTPIRIGKFFIKKNNVKRLRSHKQNQLMLKEEIPKSEILFPPEILSPREKLLIPLEIYFKYEDEIIDYMKNWHNSKPIPEELSKMRNIKSINVIKDIKDEKEQYKIPYSTLLNFLSKAKQNPEIDKEYIYGPSVSIEKIEVDNVIYPFRQYTANFFVIRASREVGSCPYVYTYSSKHNDWINEGHILYGKNNKKKEGIDEIELSQFTGKLLIKELEPEISFIDYIYIIVKYPNGEEEIFLPKHDTLRFEDNNYLVLKQGDQIKVEFEMSTKSTINKFYLRSKGYYEINHN